MRVTVVQANADLDPEANRASLRETCPTGSDLVVYPEAFARDFGKPGSPLGEHAEPVSPEPGPFVEAVAATAAERGTTIVAGMFEVSDDPDRPFNTLVVRGATSVDYRKIHLYDSFGYRESDRVRAGRTQPVSFGLGDLTIGLLTCYDLRFPEHARALVTAGADVLVVPAAWVAGERKVDHWRTLLRARAIENTAYVVAAAQAAPRYSGHSMVVGPLGDVLGELDADPGVLTADLDAADLEEARRTNPSLANRRL